MTNPMKYVWIALGILVLIGAVLFLPLKAQSQTPTVTLEWTAPGDDGNIGTASFYEMRRSTTKPDTTSVATMDTWWSGATTIPNLPVPLVAGTKQSLIVVGLNWATTYYFVMRSTDDGLPQDDGVARRNTSGYSNVATKVLGPAPDTTPPSRIVDFLAR